MTALLCSPRQRVRGPIGFAVVAALCFLIDGLIVHSPLFAEKPDVLAAAASFDLTIGVTFLWWLIVVRTGHAAARTMVPVFLVSVAAAAATLPSGHRDVVQYMRYLAVPFELAVFGAIIVGVRRANQRLAAAGTELDVPERIRAALAGPAMPPRVADVVATEASMFYYAFASWRRRPFVPSAGRGFSYHKRSGFAALLYTIVPLSLVEVTAVDFVLRVHHHVAANVLLALGLFASIWLLGFARAVQMRPIILLPDRLLVRVGVQWQVDVPLADIARLETGRGVAYPRKRSPGHLRAGPQSNALITLHHPIRAHGPYGLTRNVRTIALSLDDLRAFESAITSSPPPAPSASSVPLR